MPEPLPRFASMSACVAEGKRLLAAAANADEYEWQWQVGSWSIAVDELIKSTMPEEFCSEYYGEKVGLSRFLKADERLRLIVEWLELALH